jgi:hypothetical protein
VAADSAISLAFVYLIFTNSVVDPRVYIVKLAHVLRILQRSLLNKFLIGKAKVLL